MDGEFEWRLLPGERLLWSGQPSQGLRLVANDAFLIPFSLLWSGFTIFWEGSVLRTDAPLFFALWGIPFVLMGLYLIVGRFFVDAWLRGRTHYALTDQRVLIDRSPPFAKLIALSLDRLPELQLKLRRDGSGTIIFGQNTLSPWTRGIPFGWPGASPSPQFAGIQDAQTVFDRIQRTGRQRG